MKLTANRTAGILYLLATLATLSIWYVLLFMHNPPGINPLGNLQYFLNEPPFQWIFRWLLVLPVLCLLLAAAYFSKWSQTRTGAFSLFGVGGLLALSAWFTPTSVASSVAVFVSLPLWYGFVMLRPHLTHHSRGTR